MRVPVTPANGLQSFNIGTAIGGGKTESDGRHEKARLCRALQHVPQKWDALLR
jgi:hypothetical protein